MVLSIKNAKADQLAREPAELTGETITDAVVAALQARLEVLDKRAPDDILGYDGYGLPS